MGMPTACIVDRDHDLGLAAGGRAEHGILACSEPGRQGQYIPSRAV
ncbi:hypothetical protein HNR16_003315 [Pseudoclavibacter chungangensis]|nr:hypothetical protein [Pseudoclavibacter chungangensis]NYJ68527.1 hypothetical protein [Pseudoclavibacter chungangensis]